MIPVVFRPEPDYFEVKIRQTGHAFLTEKGIVLADVVPAKFKWKAVWTECLADLHTTYQGVCAYSGRRIELVTGAKTVEHFQPKKKYPYRAYEWANYRLVCSALNGRKSDYEDVLDPFVLLVDTFFVDLITGKIYPNPQLLDNVCQQALTTIQRLKLNDELCVKMRTNDFNDYILGHIDTDYLKRINPFIWYEARRQQLLREA